jgi:endonuclease YncB( thermonuclease family)
MSVDNADVAPLNFTIRSSFVRTWRILLARLALHPHRTAMRLITLAGFATMVPSAAFADIVGRASVVDGDTIEIHGQRIRLHGIDAPEKGQPCFDARGEHYRCGQIAAIALDAFIGASPVQCREREVDRYGRTVADCSVRGEDIELWLVKNGHAMAYRRYSGAYIGAEQEARNAKRGIWAGEAQPPWEWRHSRREGLARGHP